MGLAGGWLLGLLYEVVCMLTYPSTDQEEQEEGKEDGARATCYCQRDRVFCP
jgi:hypothetical protein